MNNLERAVIAAARRWANGIPSSGHGQELIQAVKRYEASLTPGEQEIGWHELAEGDQLKSRKNGRFYPVTHVLKVTKGYEITLAGLERRIMRPTKEEPSAIVKRGQAGQAVDTLVHVFSSGGDR
jgi:hypothetical protein